MARYDFTFCHAAHTRRFDKLFMLQAQRLAAHDTRHVQPRHQTHGGKNQKQVETKEIRLSVTIDVGDFNTKVNQAKKFLASGHKVKVSIRLKGRMMTHSDLGIENMKRFAASLEEEANVDKAPKLDGRQILMFLSPKASK